MAPTLLGCCGAAAAGAKQPSSATSTKRIIVHDRTRPSASAKFLVSIGVIGPSPASATGSAQALRASAPSTLVVSPDSKYGGSPTVPLVLTPTGRSGSPSEKGGRDFTVLVQVQPDGGLAGMLNGFKTDQWRRANTVDTSSYWALQTSPSAATSDIHVLLFATINPSTWMSQVPDATPLSALCMPGTHESLSRYGYPISTCQSEASTVAVQLAAGIRFLDVRVIAKGQGDPSQQKLLAYHGVSDERIEFGQVLAQCWAFLQGAGKNETIIMSMKSEANAETMQACFEQAYLNPTKAQWYVGTDVPTLGSVRGKIVLFSRYAAGDVQPGGIHPTEWPDSYPGFFTYSLPSGRNVETQDWYNIGSLGQLGTKFGYMQSLLESSGSDPNTLSINFASGSSFPLALPPPVAMGAFGYTGINQRLRDYVATSVMSARAASSSGTQTASSEKPAAPAAAPTPSVGAMSPLKCIFNLDYYETTADLVPLLIQANFQQ